LLGKVEVWEAVEKGNPTGISKAIHFANKEIEEEVT
jgi:hypothetical protein